MHIWIVASVLAALEPCTGFTHLESSGQTVTVDASGEMLADSHGEMVAVDASGGHAVAIGSHGDILAVDGTKETGLVRSGLIRQEEQLMRQEEHDEGQSHHTMLERRQWAKRHGNVFATRRLLHRAVAWSSLYATKIPNTVTSSHLVPIIIITLVLGFAVTIWQCVVRLRQGPARELQADGDGGSGGLGEREPLAAPVEHDFKRSPMPLTEDIYGMGIAALIRDMQRVAQGSESRGLRVSRMLISLLTLAFTMTLQVFLLVEMKHLVTSVSTNESQDTYEKYEVWMYGNDKSKMTGTSGNLRGDASQFDVTRFAKLDDAVKGAICQVPLSQPSFFIAVLLVWTLVCTAEMRSAFDMAGSLLIATPTIPNMKESIVETPEKYDGEMAICVGLSLPIKITAICMIVIPRMAVSCILLWLGCRWLTGTFGFSDVMQNAVALQFILLLKFVFYKAITPAHNQRETRNTKLQPFAEREAPSTSVFLGAFTWGVVSIVFVFFYILMFQQVLPDYQWDIHDACVGYLAGVEVATPGS